MFECTGIEIPSPEIPNFTEAPASDWQALQSAAVLDPNALLQLADLALEGNFPAEELLFAVHPDQSAYGQAALLDLTLLPRLALLAELGCGNVRNLLIELVAAGPQDFFFSLAGVAAEGGAAAFAVLNQSASLDHLAALIGYAEVYAQDPFYGPMLRAVVQSPEFCPAILDLAATGDAVAGAFVLKLAELGNPTANDWLRVPAAVNWQ
ncbi:MAG: hypothetical protein U1F66_06180 [bacterium]